MKLIWAIFMEEKASFSIDTCMWEEISVENFWPMGERYVMKVTVKNFRFKNWKSVHLDSA